jgi:hypothetical protein
MCAGLHRRPLAIGRLCKPRRCRNMLSWLLAVGLPSPRLVTESSCIAYGCLRRPVPWFIRGRRVQQDLALLRFGLARSGVVPPSRCHLRSLGNMSPASFGRYCFVLWWSLQDAKGLDFGHTARACRSARQFFVGLMRHLLCQLNVGKIIVSIRVLLLMARISWAIVAVALDPGGTGVCSFWPLTRIVV